jgi:putative MATE family efflux protein
MKQSVDLKNIWRVAFPIILSSTAQNIVNAVDTAFVGRLGEVAVGAVGNSIIFYSIFVVTAMGFSIGGEILVGRKNGESKYEQVGQIIDHCIYSFVPLALILFLFLQFFSPVLLGWLTASPLILEESLHFLTIRSWGIFFALANLIFRIFYIGITHTRILITSTCFMALVNLVLDYVFIFGKFGFPALGIEGAALASVIAEASTTVFFIVYTKRQTNLGAYHLFRFQAFRMETFRKLIKVSSPTMLQGFLALSSWMFFFLIIEKIGARALAISHMVRSVYMVLIIPMFGFSAATSTLVSNVIGQGDIQLVPRLVKNTAFLSFSCTALLFPLVLFFSENIMSLYTNDPLLIQDGIPVLHVVSISMLVFSIAYIVFSAVSGTGNTMISLVIEVLTLILYLFTTYHLGITLQLSLPIVWYSEFIYFGAMGILSILYLKYGKWRAVNV